jgi:hypothetical protein
VASPADAAAAIRRRTSVCCSMSDKIRLARARSASGGGSARNSVSAFSEARAAALLDAAMSSSSVPQGRGWDASNLAVAAVQMAVGPGHVLDPQPVHALRRREASNQPTGEIQSQDKLVDALHGASADAGSIPAASTRSWVNPWFPHGPPP